MTARRPRQLDGPGLSAAKRRGVRSSSIPAGTIQTLQPAYSPQMVRDRGAHDGWSARDAGVLSPLHGARHDALLFRPRRSSFGGVGQQIPPCATRPTTCRQRSSRWWRRCRARADRRDKYTDDKRGTRTVRLTRPLLRPSRRRAILGLWRSERRGPASSAEEAFRQAAMNEDRIGDVR